MTPEEVNMIQGAGQAFVRNFAYMVPLTLLYGMYVLIAFMAIYTLLHRRSKSRSTLVLTAMLIITFGIATTYYITYVTVAIMLMQVGLVENPDLPLAERFNIANESIIRINIASMWVGGVNGLLYLFSDGIIVWRAWAIWPERRRVILIPGILLFASFGIFLTSSSMRTAAAVNPSVIAPSSTFGSLVIAGFTMSIATNLSSTILIGYKAYRHRQFMKDTIGVRNSRAGKVLALLTESGIVYIIFQIINICLAFTDDAPAQSSLNIASHVWGVIMGFVSAMYPAIIILIVTHHQSIARTTTISDGDGAEFDAGTHISFAPSPKGGLSAFKTQTDTSRLFISNNSADTSSGEKPDGTIAQP